LLRVSHNCCGWQIDVYSLGNVFYMLLMQDWPFKGLSVETAQAKIKAGLRPDFYADVWNSTHPIDEALKTAMLMCHEQDVEKRATARQVESFLTQKLVDIDPGRLESWTTPEKI
jgi:serine/threonine protein kinase